MRLLGKKPTIDHDPNEFGQKPRFVLFRRAMALAICFAMLYAGISLVLPVFTGGPRWGWFVLMGVGFIGTSVGWLWTEFVERSDD